EGAGDGEAVDIFHTELNSASNPNTGATFLSQGTFEGWTLVTDAPEDNAGGVNVFEMWSHGDLQLNNVDEPIEVMSALVEAGDSWLELNDAAGTAYQTLGLERTITTIEGAVYTLGFDFAGPLGFPDSYSDVAVYVDDELIGYAKAESPADELCWYWQSFEFTGTGGTRTLRIVTEPCAVAPEGRGGMIDNLHLTEQIPNTGYEDSEIRLQTIYTDLVDQDGSEIESLYFEDIPVGATLTDGAHSFTATAGNRTVDVTQWEYRPYLTITPPSGFVGEFDLIVRVKATEVATGASASSTVTMTVHVLEDVSPIAFDLDGDGLRTIALGDTLGTFDLLNTGTPIRSGWLSAEDGFLALDRNGNGLIDSRSELFGGEVGEGFAQLAALDGNGDGRIDASDAAFGELLVWQDRNSNHATDEGELSSLSERGIAGLDTGYTVRVERQNGNRIIERSTATLDDGRTIEMSDVYFRVDPAAVVPPPKERAARIVVQSQLADRKQKPSPAPFLTRDEEDGDGVIPPKVRSGDLGSPDLAQGEAKRHRRLRGELDVLGREVDPALLLGGAVTQPAREPAAAGAPRIDWSAMVHTRATPPMANPTLELPAAPWLSDFLGTKRAK